MVRLPVFILIITIAASCGSKKEYPVANIPADFDPSTLSAEMVPVKKVKGQLLYMPVYSNVPYQIDTLMFDMSAFVAIHNTDLKSSLTLTKVLFFNQDGRLVDDFLKSGPYKVAPLATKDFYIPYEDKSGNGANFLIEWKSDSLINEPLVESVTLCLKPNNTVAVLSTGKIMGEIR